MSTQTAPPTTRQLANRLRSALEWLDSNGDVLPGNWNLDMHASGRLEIGWHRGQNDMARVAATLLALYGEPDYRDDAKGGVTLTWSREGDRPSLRAYVVPYAVGGGSVFAELLEGDVSE